ncbi:MAG TPA: hypothetical protein VFR29_10370 [Steroidobacteraceae bacterium]|nr:hypothetical protein [Steroidobacteraceae bacterium]
MKNWILPVAGIVLIAAGGFGLAKGEFSYTSEEHEANIAGIELSLREKERVEVPKWAAGGALALGVILLLMSRKSG